jgi:purine catabolism regulator
VLFLYLKMMRIFRLASENGGLAMIRLDRVYQVALEHFNMKLAGGERGLSRGVNWVHTVETEDYIRFLVGNELVVITGVHISDDEDLLRFTEKIHRAGSAGIVFNTGGPILRIPRSGSGVRGPE